MNTFLDELHEDHTKMPINALYHSEHEFQWRPFMNAHTLLPISINFDFLFKKYPSDFFENIWSNKLKELVKSKATLSMKEVVPSIWDPVFSECCKLLQCIENKSIKLKEVHNVTKCIGRQHNITEQLHQLHSAVELCMGRSPTTNAPPWISAAVRLVEFYLSLCKQADSAKLVLCLRDKLKLSGNFDVVEAVVSKIDSSVQEQPLSSVDFESRTAVSFLEKLSSKTKWFNLNQTFGDCLQKFCVCLKIVEWIRKETKGMQFFFILRVK